METSPQELKLRSLGRKSAFPEMKADLGSEIFASGTKLFVLNSSGSSSATRIRFEHYGLKLISNKVPLSGV